MNKLESAYKSLANAKEEKEKLTIKKQRLEELYKVLEPFCTGYGFYYTGGKRIPEIIKPFIGQRRESFGLIVFAILLYTIGIGMLDTVFLLDPDAIIMVPVSILGGITTFVASTSSSFAECFESHMKIIKLKDVDRCLDNDPKYKGKTLKEILDFLLEEKGETEELLNDIDAVIKEYESALSDANKELAEEVLASSGIEASVTIKPSMKVLAKRYESK